MPGIGGGILELPEQTVAQSLLVGNIGSNIQTAILTASVYIPTNGSIYYYLSNNNGTNFEAVNPGSIYTFTTTGSMLRWRTNLENTDGLAKPEIDTLTIEY